MLAVDRLALGDRDPPAPRADPAPLTVTDETLESIRARQTEGLGRPPAADEFAAAVERWIDEELLVREAERLGLGRRDPVVRDRLASRMAELYRARAVPDRPDEAALRALFEAHRDDYRLPPRLTLRQLFAAGPAAEPEAHTEARRRIGALAAALDDDPETRPASPDPPPGGPLLRGRRPARLAAQLGEAFAAGLIDAPLDRWLPRPSPAGWHLVRIERRTPGRQLEFAEARDRLEARWMRERAEADARRAVADMRARTPIDGWPR